jgi:hypothetical protein
MDIDIRKLAAAGLIAGVIGFGGTAIAGAQEAPDESTTTTEASADDTARDGEGCDKDGDGAADASETEATAEGTSL